MKQFFDKASNKDLASIATTVLTALATLIIALGQIWGFGHAEDIANTIYAISAFLAAILGGTTIAKVSKKSGGGN